MLEVVEVEDDHRGALAEAADVPSAGLQRLLEAPAVEQPGQRVVGGDVLELVLEAPALGDVLDLGDDVPSSPERGGCTQHPARRRPGARAASRR